MQILSNFPFFSGSQPTQRPGDHGSGRRLRNVVLGARPVDRSAVARVSSGISRFRPSAAHLAACKQYFDP